MTEGQTKTIEYVCQRRECEECGEPATHCLTFIYPRGDRRCSAPYADDRSFCMDGERYACDEHERAIRNQPPDEDMHWCSDFYMTKQDGTLSPHAHRVLYWEKVREEISEPLTVQ